MNREVAFKIIEQAYELGVHSLKFNWKGESTLNPHYSEITRYAKSLSGGGIFIDRLANSNFKIPERVREDKFIGLAALTKVKISYDSFTKEVFETQRFQGNHDVTTKNIDLFYNHPARIKSETQMVIQAVRTKLNKDEDIAGLAKKRWPEATISIRDMVAGRVNNDLDQFEHRERDKSCRQSCIQAHVRLIFSDEGDAYPCCPDVKEQLWLGNINTHSLEEIFNSNNARNLRKSLKDKSAFEFDPCKSCSSFETFKGFKPNWDS